ncbi:MAG: CHAP domain-containing protein [Aeriscardovia sp.]|nr:CHAP domain-containing protein [Aeriscardovia sp.]
MTNTELLKIAKKHLGQGGAVFRKYCGLPSGAAWCNAFVTYIAHEGGVSSLYFNGAKETYCPHSMAWCKKNLAQIPLYLALPMDIIYFDWDRNNVPNHIGFVRGKKSTTEIYTIEGNTSNKVMEKTRPAKYVCGIYRPHFKPPKTISKHKLNIDGEFGFNSIFMLQVALGITTDGVLGLNTVKALQKKAGCTADGQWGKGTSKAVQKMIGAKVDGDFGPASVKALQTWINKRAFPSSSSGGTATAPTVTKPTTSTTNAEKIINKALELAWPYGTPSSKWDYKKGSPTTNCKAAMNKLGYKTKEKWSDCGRFATTVVRASGVDPTFVAMKGVKEAFPKSAKFNIVLSGKRIPDNFLKAGDIVRYKKTKGQHTLIYMGNGRVCEARHYKRFGNIYKDEKRYNKKSTKAKSIQVLRAR